MSLKIKPNCGFRVLYSVSLIQPEAGTLYVRGREKDVNKCHTRWQLMIVWDLTILTGCIECNIISSPLNAPTSHDSLYIPPL